jgi:hypothetical protein
VNGISDNPFAVLTLIAAPAVFTNASSVLALGTGNRLGRVVDRVRVVTGELRSEHGHDETLEGVRLAQLARLETRSQLLLKAMTFFYAAIGLFAAASLISILGAILASSQFRLALEITSLLSLIAGTLGFIGMATGCSLLVAETRLAVRSLLEESQFIRAHFQRSQR